MRGENDEFRIAIVGGGPRGLAACESVVRRAEGSLPLRLTVFEPRSVVGAGPNHDPRQTGLNRLNIPLRAIDLPAPDRAVTSVGSFGQWAAEALPECGADNYPARAKLGAYLEARWHDLIVTRPSDTSITTVAHAVTAARRQGGRWVLIADGHAHGPFDEVLLCLGHQPVEPDEQIRRWRRHAEACDSVLMPAYPSSAILESADRWREQTIAIRGLALGMIDVMRLLTIGIGGRFERAAQDEKLCYRPCGREPARILPFSLDGIPPAPKPASAALDAAFDVEAAELARFTVDLAQALPRGPGDAMACVCDALTRLAGDVLSRFGVERAPEMVRAWLNVELDDAAEHEARDRPPAAILADRLAMALGRRNPCAGYAVGQVWRKLQTPLRKAYNPTRVPPETARVLVRFDEGLKRFSYGPPTRAAMEMLALVEAGILDLHAVDDPDILLVDGGWRLSAEDGEATATVMIDAVLASPDLQRCSSPLVEGLREAGLLVAVATKLGARTATDGRVIDADGEPVPGLSLLGRLATGSVIATDSIHDCFGEAVARWADGVWRRACAGADAEDRPPIADG